MFFMKKFYLNLFLIIISFSALQAQTTFKVRNVKVAKTKTVLPAEAEAPFNVRVYNQEAPNPNGDSYKAFLNEQKKKLAKTYPRKQGLSNPKHKTQAAQPSVEEGLYLYRMFRGERQIYSGGIPNDNAMAISNNNILLGAVNSALWAYDVDNDTAILPRQTMGLDQFVDNANLGSSYDPKLIYDEEEDRFILVFLQGNIPSQSKIWVCFSSTNNPTDPWYTYYLPGNPLDNNRWTDFPAVSIVGDEIFITGNLIIPDVSWQIGFDGSVIWQLNKQDGFANADSLGTRFYSDIKHNGTFTRNLHPVRGLGSSAPEPYFLSNRNFDISNDTIFVLKVGSKLSDPNADLSVNVAKTDVPYGVPPNGIQADTDTTDPTKGLQTNDGRVLGAVTNGEWIHYVSTTNNPETGRASIYHGILENLSADELKITGRIIGDAIKDYAYPNIAYSGNEACDNQMIIGFNYTSMIDFPGVAAIYVNDLREYSDVVTVKEGENYVDKHSDSYERWGDYFGIQPKYNEPGKIWTAGFYGFHESYNRNGTWLNKLGTPDDEELSVSIIRQGQSQFCKGEVEVFVSGGIPPYTIEINDSVYTEAGKIGPFCTNDSVIYNITDTRGCSKSGFRIINSDANPTTTLFPNPTTADLVTRFTMPVDGIASAYIVNMDGRVVEMLFKGEVKAGLNELLFDLSPLEQGLYVLKIVRGEDEELVTERVFKRD